MRLGSYLAHLRPGTIASAAYGTKEINERHRHRYEVNPEYVSQLEEAGLVFSGVSPDGHLMEIAELPVKGSVAKDVAEKFAATNIHPFFLGTQFHPELRARPLAPHPLFTAFVKAALKRREGNK